MACGASANELWGARKCWSTAAQCVGDQGMWAAAAAAATVRVWRRQQHLERPACRQSRPLDCDPAALGRGGPPRGVAACLAPSPPPSWALPSNAHRFTLVQWMWAGPYRLSSRATITTAVRRPRSATGQSSSPRPTRFRCLHMCLCHRDVASRSPTTPPGPFETAAWPQEEQQPLYAL